MTNKKLLSISINPILNFHSRHQTKMLDIVCYYCQVIMQSCGTNKDVKTTYVFIKVLLYLVQGTPNLSIFIKNVANVIDCNILT